ncbi:PASTA domain-containing protein [Gynurincola endophyticus]|uniref:PASTA domain-containing protein n=1 Tax=Gynurincola endophyticus TaxID=2479004 RepID=UPI001F190482|nr:PASTA domain-containing protein [Gynurincola endophyticus]
MVFKFITSKPLWVNILAGLGVLLIVLFVFLQSLKLITKHGHTLHIPNVIGKSLQEAESILSAQGFEVELQDSIYQKDAPAGMVLRQFPDANETVKINRTVYITINRWVAPLIDMPKFEGLSFRSAEVSIKQLGLLLGDTSYRQDFAKNAVLEQRYQGKRIEPGKKVPLGSKIDLVLGSGLSNIAFSVPDLFGMTYADAKILLESNNLYTGLVFFDRDVTDTNSAYIYKQTPERITADRRINKIRRGETIDLWMSTTLPVRKVDTSVSNNIDQPY